MLTGAIMSRNAPEYAIAHFGGAPTGAVLVDLMPADAPGKVQKPRLREAFLRKTAAGSRGRAAPDAAAPGKS